MHIFAVRGIDVREKSPSHLSRQVEQLSLLDTWKNLYGINGIQTHWPLPTQQPLCWEQLNSLGSCVSMKELHETNMDIILKCWFIRNKGKVIVNAVALQRSWIQIPLKPTNCPNSARITSPFRLLHVPALQTCRVHLFNRSCILQTRKMHNYVVCQRTSI